MSNSKIDNISPSFCAAKWLQVTIYLQNGVNHSCHHPDTHKIPLDLVKKDVGVFHNTPLKKQARAEMLAGERPSECSYCWAIEDSQQKSSSDRYVKSNDEWAVPYLDKISKLDPSENIDPTYLEVSLGNECNLACSYCKADSSSRIHRELMKYGDYPTSDEYGKIDWLKSDGRLPLYQVEENPYIESFKKWLDHVLPNLHVFRLTGGEPLINPLFDEVLDIVAEKGNDKLELSINTNLSIKRELVTKTTKKLHDLQKAKKIDRITIFTSLESFGDQAEYIRHGLNMELFKENVLNVLNNSDFKLVFMVTFNMLSIPGFKDFLAYILELKKTYEGKHDFGQRVIVDTSYLRSPEFMSVKYVDDELMKLFKDSVDFMDENNIVKKVEYGFSSYEINKLKRIYIWLKSFRKEKLLRVDFERSNLNFVNYFDEYDRRRDTSFLDTFPEFKKYYFKCKLLKKQYVYSKANEK